MATKIINDDKHDDLIRMGMELYASDLNEVIKELIMYYQENDK